MRQQHGLAAAPRVLVPLLLAGVLAAGCGGEQDWYYHWDCHGDSECLSLNPTGEPAGTRNEGPVEVNCTQLMAFASRFWNMPPATNSCDHSATAPRPPPPVPVVTTFTPTSGVVGTPVTVSGDGFPAATGGVTVSLGGTACPVASITPNQVVFSVPDMATGSYPISVRTAGGTAISSASFTLRDPVLTVGVSGDGAVVSSPAGIDCGGGADTCSAAFPHHAVVALAGTAGARATFTGWMGGGCAGTGPGCTVTLDADTTVTASFLSQTLTVVVAGNGRVVSDPSGIDCGSGHAACTAAFLPGSSVTLTEAPGAAATFGGWSGGGCSPEGPACTLTMSSNLTVTAPFLTSILAVVPVAVNGTAGTGTITSEPPGISCTGTGAFSTGCSAPFAGGTQVTLTVTPGAGASFAGWSGSGCAGSGPCVVRLDANATVTAQYCVPHGTMSFTTPGTSSHVACADALTVQAWGAGGGGGAESSRFGQGSGSGGGGGGYGAATVAVAPGATYLVTVGAGGRAGWGYAHGTPDPAQVPCSGGANGPGGGGGASSFDTLVVASGGEGGSYGPTAGGAGGTSGAATSVAGSAGQAGGAQQSSPGGAGGAAGNGGAGGAGGTGIAYDTPPPPGTDPNGSGGSPPGGGGGGGAWINFFCYDGGAGASGQVIVSW